METTQYKKNLYWMQAGGCSGDSMSLLNLESPDIFTLMQRNAIEVLWHPSLSNTDHKQHDSIIEKILNDELKLDIFCLEGNVVLGPDGSGMFDTFHAKPKKDLIQALVTKADYVIAVGTCAAFGGFGSYESDELEGVGLGFLHEEEGGFLGKGFRSKKGLPIINIPGCPIHPKAFSFVLSLLDDHTTIQLDELNRPIGYYKFTVHQGCSRNEHHEYKVEEDTFGKNGCMFFNLGCKGPITHASCNVHLWNEVNSKTRAGVPCFGCTSPSFPHQTPFFETPNIAGTPLHLPEGVDRAYYLAYKDMAALAAPERLKEDERK